MKTSSITCHDLILAVIIDYVCVAKVTIICETEEKKWICFVFTA
jgi:hypothetical protein